MQKNQKLLFSASSMNKGMQILYASLAIFISILIILLIIKQFQSDGVQGAIIMIIVALFICSPIYILLFYITSLKVFENEVHVKYNYLFWKPKIVLKIDEIIEVKMRKVYAGRGSYWREITFVTVDKSFPTRLPMEDDISEFLEAFTSKIKDGQIQIEREDLDKRQLYFEASEKKQAFFKGVLISVSIPLSVSFFICGIGWFVGEEYRGSIGYQNFKIYYKANSLEIDNLNSNISFLKYGENTNRYIVNPNILASEIDPVIIDKIFTNYYESIDTLTPYSLKDSIIEGTIELRGNFWTFLFQSKNSFYLKEYKMLSPTASIPVLQRANGWRLKANLYALSSMIQAIVLILFWKVESYSQPFRIKHNILEFRKSLNSVKSCTVIAALFLLSTLWKAWMDLPFGNIFTWIWDIVLIGYALYMIYVTYRLWYNSLDYVQFNDNFFAFKDNEREMKIPYTEITDLMIKNHRNKNGFLTFEGVVMIGYQGDWVEIKTNLLNVGDSDLEIATELSNRTKVKLREDV
jgi:hypothetical protein